MLEIHILMLVLGDIMEFPERVITYCILKGSALREEDPRDIYITGKEYRASGL